jgi:hypothetical protein
MSSKKLVRFDCDVAAPAKNVSPLDVENSIAQRMQRFDLTKTQNCLKIYNTVTIPVLHTAILAIVAFSSPLLSSQTLT